MILHAVFDKKRFVPNTTNTAEISIFFNGQNFRNSAGIGRRRPEWLGIVIG